MHAYVLTRLSCIARRMTHALIAPCHLARNSASAAANAAANEICSLRARLKAAAQGLAPAIFRRRTREAELLQVRRGEGVACCSIYAVVVVHTHMQAREEGAGMIAHVRLLPGVPTAGAGDSSA